MKRLLVTLMTVALFVAGGLALGACSSEEGDLEKAGKDAGKQADKAMDEAGKKLEGLGD